MKTAKEVLIETVCDFLMKEEGVETQEQALEAFKEGEEENPEFVEILIKALETYADLKVAELQKPELKPSLF